MKNSVLFTTICTVIVLLLNINFAKAQNIDEKELKLNVGKIENSTQQIKNLEPVVFKYNVDKYQYLKLPKESQYGFLASNVETQYPHLVQQKSKVYEVSKNNSKVAKYQEVNVDNLIPVLVAAIKEQQEQIDVLKLEVEKLKSKK